LSDKKITEILELLNYGKMLPEIWKDRRELEFSRKIATLCNIDLKTAGSIASIVINIIRKTGKEEFASKRVEDLKKLGFGDSDIDRFKTIAQILREKAAYKEMNKVDDYIQLSEEVLPKITEIECAFDIRCKIEKEKVKTTLPMVLLKFKIKGEGEPFSKEIIFQTDIGSLRKISRSFTTMYRNASVLKEYTLQAKKGEADAE
jgi:hypothetical protein